MNRFIEMLKRDRKILILSLILVLIVNLIFNYTFLISLFNKTEPIIYNLGDIQINEDENIIKNIDSHVNLIEINFLEIPDKLTISYTGEDFEDYDHMNEDYVNDNIKKEQLYVMSSINSNVQNIKINAESGVIENVIINPSVKYEFNIFLIIVVLFVILFPYYMIKYTSKLNFKKIKYKYIISLIIVSLASLCFVLYISFTNITGKINDMYNYAYVNAIMDGKLYLDINVSDGLKNDDNPYDTSNRDYRFMWDASYYEGKYYCYFGILPLLELFVPFTFITGNYLATAMGCLIYAILGILATYLLFRSIIKKYFKDISFQTYIMSFLFIVAGSRLFWCMFRPSFYELVSLAAYVHVLFGLYLVLFSDNRLKNFFGYLLLALSVLCRPTSLICSLLVLPKIINNIKMKKFKLKDFIVLVIPYLVVGIITMYLNYVRFDSIFEFGVTYQLTTNNLSNYKFSLINSIYGIYNFLFNKIHIGLFPFGVSSVVTPIPVVTDFHVEEIGGGIFTTSILGFVLFFIPIIFKYVKEKEIKVYTITSLVVAFILMISSSGIGALIGRYMLDFNYIIYFVIVILCLYVVDIFKNKKVNNIYMILMFVSIFINLLMTFTNPRS